MSDTNGARQTEGVEHGAGRTERFETVIIGGGQSGLSVGYHLARRGLPFVILDASERIGDSWRNRWDSLRLFTPARFNGLDGMPFPAPSRSYPTKDEMADYLESYAERFDLPVRSGVRVDGLSKRDGRFVITAGERRFEADNVVVAMATFQKPRIPDFADRLDPGIVQIRSADYRNPGQLRDGAVLIVGGGNSGAEIGLDLARGHQVWLSGRDTGAVPFRIDRLLTHLLWIPLVLRVLFHRVLSVATPIGRKARPKILRHGGPLVRTKNEDLQAAGIQRVARTAGVLDGAPVLDDGRVLDINNVVWCTGFEPGFSWIDLPIHGDLEPVHESGIVHDQPGLYFVGLLFLHSHSSTMIHGVGRDAARVARAIAGRRRSDLLEHTKPGREERVHQTVAAPRSAGGPPDQVPVLQRGHGDLHARR